MSEIKDVILIGWKNIMQFRLGKDGIHRNEHGFKDVNVKDRHIDEFLNINPSRILENQPILLQKKRLAIPILAEAFELDSTDGHNKSFLDKYYGNLKTGITNLELQNRQLTNERNELNRLLYIEFKEHHWKQNVLEHVEIERRLEEILKPPTTVTEMKTPEKKS